MAGGEGAVRACLVCGRPVAPPLRVYCCYEHAREAARQRDKQYAWEVRNGRRQRKKRNPPRRYADEKQAEGQGQERTCLKCGKSFLSTGAGNRICVSCRSLNSYWLRGGGSEATMFHAALTEEL